MNPIINNKKPILFIVFNRPDVTRTVFKAIREYGPSQLFIAADGPRFDKAGEVEKCQEVRNIINEIDWDCEVSTLFKDKNVGCRLGPSSAINWFFSHVENGIILEDDCLPNSSFFVFCEQMLDKYEHDESIFLISGQSPIWNSDMFKQNNKYSYYFSKYPKIWGWASWRRAWKHYDVNLEHFAFDDILPSLNKDERQFWKPIFDKVKSNEINTWDYQLTFAMLKCKAKCITPIKNLISNIGFGADATHTTEINNQYANNPTQELDVILHPQNKRLHKEADLYFFEYQIRGWQKPSFLERVHGLYKRIKRRFNLLLES